MKKQLLFIVLFLSLTLHAAHGQNNSAAQQSSQAEAQILYNANGCIIKDSSKNITNITYNFLNLPERIEFGNNRSITYTWGADGVKRRVVYRNGDQIEKEISYCKNIVYEDGELSRILFDGGYITFNDTTPTYHFYLQDHLGNNRVVVDQDGNVEEVNHYYPFGETFYTGTADVQPYKYNGKELDRTYGLNLYDYSARQMDPRIGRFTSMDPLAEKYYSVSPYVYCKNNPINRIDPNGKDDFRFSGRGQIVRIPGTQNNGSKVDRLYANNGSFIQVQDKNLLPGLNRNKGGDSNRLRFYNFTPNVEDAVNVFKFAADNTDKEWKLDVYTDGEVQTAAVATNLRKTDVGMTDNYDEAKGKTKVVDIHSHPDEEGTRGGSANDMRTAQEGVKSAVYHKHDKKLYEYNSRNSSINSVPANTNTQILDYIWKRE